MVTRPKPTADEINRLRNHASLGMGEAYRTLYSAWCRAEIVEIKKDDPRVAEVLSVMLDLMKMVQK